MPSVSGSPLLPTMDPEVRPDSLRESLKFVARIVAYKVRGMSRRVFVDLSRDFQRSVFLAGEAGAGRHGCRRSSIATTAIATCSSRFIRLLFPWSNIFASSNTCGPMI